MVITQESPERGNGGPMTSDVVRPAVYFPSCGEINTTKTIELGLNRTKELGIGTVLVASERSPGFVGD